MLLKSYDLYEVHTRQIDGSYGRHYNIATAATSSYTAIAKHISLDGVGIPPVTRHYQSNHQIAGGIDIGYTLRPRNLVWKMMISAATESAFDAARDAIVECFNPHLALRLVVTTVDGYDAGDSSGVRNGFTLDCFVNGPIDFRQSEQLGHSSIVTVPLYAPDPVWWVNNAYTANWYLSGSSGTLNETIDYYGTWETWPSIALTGEIEDPRIEVTWSTGEGDITYNIDLDGTTIGAGDTYYFDLAPGAKTVVDSVGDNKIGDIADFSTFSQLRLHAKPLGETSAAHAVNVYYTSISGSPYLQFLWYPRYIAI